MHTRLYICHRVHLLCFNLKMLVVIVTCSFLVTCNLHRGPTMKLLLSKAAAPASASQLWLYMYIYIYISLSMYLWHISYLLHQLVPDKKLISRAKTLVFFSCLAEQCPVLSTRKCWTAAESSCPTLPWPCGDSVHHQWPVTNMAVGQ